MAAIPVHDNSIVAPSYLAIDSRLRIAQGGNIVLREYPLILRKVVERRHGAVQLVVGGDHSERENGSMNEREKKRSGK